MLRPLVLASVLAALSLAACTDDGDPAAPTVEGAWRLVPHASLTADQPLTTWTFGADGMLTIDGPDRATSTGPYTFEGGFLTFQPGDQPGTDTLRVYANLGRDHLLVDEAQPLGAAVGVAGEWQEVVIRDGAHWDQTYVIQHDLSLVVTSLVPDSVPRTQTGVAIQNTGSQFQFRYSDGAVTTTRPVYALNGSIGFTLLERL